MRKNNFFYSQIKMSHKPKILTLSYKFTAFFGAKYFLELLKPGWG